MENCLWFVVYNNIESFWHPILLKFLKKLHDQEWEKHIAPPSHHFHGLYSYWPKFSPGEGRGGGDSHTHIGLP